MPDLYFAFIDINTQFDDTKISSLQFPERVIFSTKRDDVDLVETYSINSCAFLGNDSGPAHYFSMLNHGLKPVVVLFTDRIDPGRWSPTNLFKETLSLNVEGNVITKNQYNYTEWQKIRETIPVERQGKLIREIPLEAVISQTLRMIEMQDSLIRT